MVSGDVFRSPSSPMSLCVQVGSGVQILISSFITLFFAALGEWAAGLGCSVAALFARARQWAAPAGGVEGKYCSAFSLAATTRC